MKRVKISENLIGYQHEGKTDNSLGYNSYVFLNGKEALVLDTAYPEHLNHVIEDLKEEGIIITKVLPSHYHPDHFEGLRLLDGVEIFGTHYSLETLNEFELSEDEEKIFRPTTFIKEGEEVWFGDHTFKIIIVQGHSDCSMFILINNQYLHIGDTYMTLNTGEHSLPYVAWDGVEKHMEALKELIKYNKHTIFLSHGSLCDSVENMMSGIQDRIRYFESLLKSDNKVSVDEALLGTQNTFINHSWREYVK